MNSLIRGIVGQGTTAAAFSPSDISNLAIWLDADDASTITDTSGSVEQWNDKSGNARHVFDTVAGSPTTGTETINGLNVIDFPGGTSNIVLDTASTTTLTQPYTLAAVAQGVASDRLVGGGGSVFLQYNGNGTWMYYAGTVQDGTTSFTPLNATVCIVIGIFDGANSELRVNGGSESTANPGTNSLDLLQVGADGAGILEWDGQIGEVLAYDKAVSGTELSNLETYLADKWGVTI